MLLASPVPVIDGQCRDEYPDGEVVALPYAGVAHVALLRFKHDASYLYVCSDTLLQSASDTEFVSVLFDPNHSGGSSVATGDVRFDLLRSGVRRAFHGNIAGGFDSDPGLNGAWQGATRASGARGFTVEFRIPVTSIGGTVPGTTSGFFARHNSSALVIGSGVPWPVSASRAVPATWGDLIWGPSELGAARLDVAMISQGLSGPPPIPPLSAIQRTRATPELVAGKRTLIRTQLWGEGVVTGAECVVERADGVHVASVPAESTAPDDAGRSLLNSAPRGILGPSDAAYDCWIRGPSVAREGIYRFAIVLSIRGRPTRQRIDLAPSLGPRIIFTDTRDLKVLFWTWELPPTTPNYQPWTLTRYRQARLELLDLQRVFPLRDGVGPAASRASDPREAGLRYVFTLPAQCPDPPSCASVYALSQQALARSNDLRRVTPGADVLDFAQALQLGTGNGGQAQIRRSSCAMAVSIDATNPGAQAWAMGQEIAHCFGAVSPSSPNTNVAAGDPAHSMNYIVPVALGQLAVNTRSRQTIASPFSLMFAFNIPPDPTDRDMMMEVFEWKTLYGGLLRYGSAAVTSARRASAAGGDRTKDKKSATRSVIELLGVLRENDAQVSYSAHLAGRSLSVTPKNPNGDLALRFRTKDGRRLHKLRFDLRGETTHSHSGLSQQSFFLRASVPRGSSDVSVLVGDRLAETIHFSRRAPTISAVSIRGGRHGQRVSWRAHDDDSKQLRYALLLRLGSRTPELLISGLRQKSYVLRTDLLPTTTSARVIVEASDGFNIARRTKSLVISKRP